MRTMESIGGLDITSMAWLTMVALVVTGALLRAQPSERITFLNTLWLFMMGLAGEVAAQALLAFDFPRAGSTVHIIFRILAAFALIRLFGFAVFRMLLP